MYHNFASSYHYKKKIKNEVILFGKILPEKLHEKA